MSSNDQSADLPLERAALPVSEIERLLCTGRDGALDTLALAAVDAWQMQLPSLASFADWPDDAPRPKICIATEQVAGPVRNGGIGNTYASLALMLADAGFDVTVLYLRGSMVETRTIDHWVADYAKKGVNLVPVPNYAAEERLQTGADGWLHAPYNMMRWLIDHPMDVVHVSEWRGSAYLCLLAKRQGLAFAQTLFLVKTSSPWMWNRLYGAHFVEKLDDLAKIHAERQSVELADVVIGGSLHLLRWMASQGYDLPRTRTFVQPNVATFGRLQPLMAQRHLAGGTRVPIDEFVFFGRLELRKGLFVFCQAIRRLIRKGVPLPPRITFMGKPGGRMPSHPDLEAPDYLRMISRDWPTQVEILTEFQQLEAVQYLLSGPRLAVMPSIIENSSMAIYEAAICGIPCVASDVGGNSELIVADDHDEVLCAAHPVALGDKLEEALAKGGYVPRPSFDNDQNLRTWQQFHRQLGGPLHEALLAQTRPATPGEGAAATASVCVYCAGDQAALAATLAALAAQTTRPHEIILGIDAESSDYADVAKALADLHGVTVRVIEAYDLDAGAAFDLMARDATGDFLHFLWEGATLVPAAIGTLLHAARSGGAHLLTYLHRVHNAAGQGKEVLRGLILGSLPDQFYRNDIRELPLFVRRTTYRQLGGYSADYRVIAHDHELVARAIAAGLRCETVLRELGGIHYRSADWLRKAGYDIPGSNFRAIRPILSAAPLALRDGLLCARGTVNRSGARPAAPVAPLSFAAGAAPAAPRPRPASPQVAAKAPPIPRPISDPQMPGLSDHLARLLGERRVRQSGDVVGQFLGIYQGRLYGWACDVTAPGQTLDIELTVDGKTRSSAAAQRFAPWADVPPEARQNGFVIDLPAAYQHNEDGTHLVLAVAGSGLVLAQGVAVPPGITLDRCGVAGSCEANRNGMLAGWACFPEEPDRVVELAAYIGDRFLARFLADLPHAESPNGKGGFQFPIPDALLAEGKMQIDVVMAETSIALPRSPLAVDGQRVGTNQRRSLWRWGK
jgi:glycosyltransferase involved in cell wall biosynthesis